MTLHQLPLTADVAPPLEVLIAGQPRAHLVRSAVWKGKRKPVLADGKRVPIVLARRTRGGPPLVRIDQEEGQPGKDTRIKVSAGTAMAPVSRAVLWVEDMATTIDLPVTAGEVNVSRSRDPADTAPAGQQSGRPSWATGMTAGVVKPV